MKVVAAVPDDGTPGACCCCAVGIMGVILAAQSCSVQKYDRRVQDDWLEKIRYIV